MPDILEYEGKTIIHVHVPMDGEIHSYKGVIYDRVADARDSVLQKRGLTAVQSYSDKSNDVLMTRAQIWKYDSLRGEARRNYANRLEQGLSVG